MHSWMMSILGDELPSETTLEKNLAPSSAAVSAPKV